MEDSLNGIRLSQKGLVMLDSDDWSIETEDQVFHDDGMLTAMDLLHQNTSCGVFSPDSTGKLLWVMSFY